MKLILGSLILCFSFQLFAGEKTGAKKHEHREHGAHVHGSGKLAIAFDDKVGKIEFKGAAEIVLGFEHKPKNKKDEKIVADAVATFEKEMTNWIQFEKSLNCRFSKESIGQVPEEGEESSGEHSDWAANFAVSCVKSPVGTKVVIDFAALKHLDDMDITVLVDNIQKSAEYKKKPVTIELK